MEDSDIFNELNSLKKDKEIKKGDLLKILQKYCNTISVYDMMVVSTSMQEDGKFVQKGYRKGFLKSYVDGFILRINEISALKDINNESIDIAKFKESLDSLEKNYYKEREKIKQNNRFPLIYSIISIYTTFILNEPIHSVGTPFPGKLYVEEKNGTFYCPVKDAQSENENAVCSFCIAVQTPNIH